MSNKTKNIILIILIVGLVVMTVVYAALSTALRIGGTANISEAKWDIHFANFDDTHIPANAVGGGTNTGVIKSVSTNATAITNLKVDLKKPGDTIKYKFDIVNAGTIDAKLNTFDQTINCSVESACSNVTYSVTCLKGSSSFTQGGTLPKNSSVNCELNMTYNVDASSIADDVTINATANWNFVQN